MTAHRPGSPSDAAVSPVVGMILVLAISVVGIAAILYWGLPAIDEMKVNVEYRSVQTQFSELDSTIRELVAGTTEKTAKRWQPAINRGEVSVVNNSEGWLYAVELYNATYNNFTYAGFSDGDNTFTIYNRGGPLGGVALVKVEAYIVTGTSTLTTLNVSKAGITPRQMVGTDLPLWMNNTPQTFQLFVKDAGTPTPQPITGGTFKLRIFTQDKLIAEAWYMNTGRIDYTLRGITEKTISQNNGALILGDTGSYTIANSPPVAPVTNTSGVPRAFGRAVMLQGNASFAGEDRFDLLISLYSTSTLASYDCAKTDMSDCVMSAKMFQWGKYGRVWGSYLNNTGQGYNYNRWTETTTNEEFLERREWKMAYTLLASNVRLS